jgi:hypothetical protein
MLLKSSEPEPLALPDIPRLLANVPNKLYMEVMELRVSDTERLPEPLAKPERSVCAVLQIVVKVPTYAEAEVLPETLPLRLSMIDSTSPKILEKTSMDPEAVTLPLPDR